MKQTSKFFTHLQKDDGKSISQKFEDSGLLHNIKSPATKEKILKALELAFKILNANDTFREKTSVYVFPTIRLILSSNYSIANEQNDENYFLVDSFKFDEQKMLEFINFISDCLDLSNYEKYISVIDVEAYLSLFLAKVYVNEQNSIIRNKAETDRLLKSKKHQ
jgi:hypothetical protein